MKKKKTGKASTGKRSNAAKRGGSRKKPAFSRSTLKKLRDLLLEHRERITENFKNLRQAHLGSSQREATGDLSGYSLHMADLATDTFDKEFALKMASSEQDIIYTIDQALRRVEEKTYGYCELCGKTIKLTRLKAVPWARLCLDCKKIEETGVEIS